MKRLPFFSSASFAVIAVLSAIIVCAGATDAVAAAHAELGTAVATCDFNGDGFADVAAGAPSEDVGAAVAAGVVHVLYGTPQGLSEHEQTWHEGTPGVPGSLQAGDRFGETLTAGDFDGDGFCDLAIGVPHKGIGGAGEAGVVIILRGGPHGLSTAGAQLWSEANNDIAGAAEPGAHFGDALAAGDLNHDGFDDLAIGIPDEEVGAVPHAGAVRVLYGSPAGLAAGGDQLLEENQLENGSAEEGNEFGAALTTGDFNSDGFADLAIGVPGEDAGPLAEAGAVRVLYGAPTGLSIVGDQFWNQNHLTGGSEAGDRFGSSLAAGDFDSDGFADLAIGVPEEDIHGISNAGAVNVIYGTATGLTATGAQLWHRNTNGIKGFAIADAQFGTALTAADFNGDGFADLAIGAPGDTVKHEDAAGSVTVLYGSRHRLSGNGNQLWTQNSLGIMGISEAGDFFGASLASGDFDGDGFADIVIGVPGEDVPDEVDAGGIQVIYGGRAKLRAPGNRLLTSRNITGGSVPTPNGARTPNVTAHPTPVPSECTCGTEPVCSCPTEPEPTPTPEAAFVKACRDKGIILPGILPNQATCTDATKTDANGCNGWKVIGASEYTGTAQLAVGPRPARLYEWQKNNTLCFYLYRGVGEPDNVKANGVHCYDYDSSTTPATSKCNVCALDLHGKTATWPELIAADGTKPDGTKAHDNENGPRPGVPGAAFKTIDNCSQCHAPGPITPKATFKTKVSGETEDLNALCAAVGGPVWIGAPATDEKGDAWLQQNAARHVDFGAVLAKLAPKPPDNCSGCHVNGFVKASDEFCLSVLKNAFNLSGAMRGKFGSKAACEAFTKAMGCDAIPDNPNPLGC